MTSNKKDYSLNTVAIPDRSVVDGPCPWVWNTSVTKIDFQRFQHQYGDYSKLKVDRGELLDQCRSAIWGMRHELTDSSVVNLWECGLKILFLFVDETETKIASIHEITTEHMASLVFWLKTAKNTRTGKIVSYVTARRRYTAIKSILSYYSRQGLFDKKLFPINPFPDSNRAGKGIEPYGKTEMQRIMKALYFEYKAIQNDESTLSERVQLAIYLFLIIAKTGINKTPLEEASRNCLSPHPLQPDKSSVLLTYKRRGMNTHAVSIRNSNEISRLDNLPNSVADMIKEVISVTEHLVPEAKTEEKDRIWLYKGEGPEKVTTFKRLCLSSCAKIIATKHNLKNQDDQPLTISASRLRKTFATRIWQLSGGDIWKTARLLGNTPQITDRHYLDVTPEMEKNHRFVGRTLEINARGLQSDSKTIKRFASEAGLSESKAASILRGENNTGVSRCSDPLSGKYAGGDGSPCTKFLHCFRCPNQIVLEDDLYRLYSFYWLILSERPYIGRKRWKRLYGWLIREIDNKIAPSFNKKLALDAKESARVEPHPMWKQRKILGAEL